MQPRQRRRDRRVLVAQALHKLHRERGHKHAAMLDVQRRQHVPGAAPAQAEQVVGERVGRLSRGAAADDRVGQAAEVLHQHNAQRDRQGPQLADGQWLHALVRIHEPAQRFRIEAAVRVRNERPRDPVHARVAGKRTVGQLRQLAIKARRQVVPDLPQLFVDHEKVVDQPLGGRRDPALDLDGRADDTVRLAQHPAVVLDAWQQRAARRVGGRDPLRGSKASRVLLQPLDAEQLGADRFLERLERRVKERECHAHDRNPGYGTSPMTGRPGAAASAGAAPWGIALTEPTIRVSSAS